MDIAFLRSRLTYCSETGRFTWRVSNRGHRQAGDEAGSVTGRGYWRVKVDQKAYLAHRLAWAMHYGCEPDAEIDHVDGNPLNNRIANLRLATRTQNCQNRDAAGVRYEPDRNRWLARICVDRKQMNLGRYKTEAEARAAYDAARKVHFKEFARAG